MRKHLLFCYSPKKALPLSLIERLFVIVSHPRYFSVGEKKRDDKAEVRRVKQREEISRNRMPASDSV